MDPVINSQTQSALIRVLSSVDSAAGNFTHHVPDNVPPVSFTEVIAKSATSFSFGDGLRVEIPQLGYIEDITAVFQWELPDAVSAAVTTKPKVAQVYELFRYAALQSRRRDLQRVWSRNMRNADCRGSLAEAVDMEIKSKFYVIPPASGKWNAYVRNSSGYQRQSDGVAAPGNPTYTPLRYEARVSLPFSVLQNPAIQLQSLFVETLEVYIETYSLYGTDTSMFLGEPGAWGAKGAAIGAGTAITFQDAFLNIRYRNFHDETENTIRNENYVSGTPATILSCNTFEETPTSIAVPAAFEDDKIITAANKAGVHALLVAQTAPVSCSTQLRSKNIAYAINFCLGAADLTGYRTMRHGWILQEARLKANGRTLHTFSEMDLHFHQRQSYLKTITPYTVGDRVGMSEVKKMEAGNHLLPQAFCIQFGMQYAAGGMQFNTGALGLSSLTSVVLETDWVLDPYTWFGGTEESPIDGGWAHNNVQNRRDAVAYNRQSVFVYVEHFQLLRIDPDNGAITVSLDI